MITNHRHSTRLKGYDYSLPGAYFVTILAYKRCELFAKVVDGQMILNEFGIIAVDEWFKTARLRRNISLYPDEMVVMPNHIHGIIRINSAVTEHCKGAASLRPYSHSNLPDHNVPPDSLGAIVRAFKAAVTYRINGSGISPGTPIWHRNYYDHIIRDDGELQKIWEYIANNPREWVEDQFNSAYI